MICGIIKEQVNHESRHMAHDKNPCRDGRGLFLCTKNAPKWACMAEAWGRIEIIIAQIN